MIKDEKLFITNFGGIRRWKEEDGKHIEQSFDHNNIELTQYDSIWAYQGSNKSR